MGMQGDIGLDMGMGAYSGGQASATAMGVETTLYL